MVYNPPWRSISSIVCLLRGYSTYDSISLYSCQQNHLRVRQNSWLSTHNPALPAHIPPVRPNLSHSRQILYVIDRGIPASRFQPNPFYPACHNDTTSTSASRSSLKVRWNINRKIYSQTLDLHLLLSHYNPAKWVVPRGELRRMWVLSTCYRSIERIIVLTFSGAIGHEVRIRLSRSRNFRWRNLGCWWVIMRWPWLMITVSNPVITISRLILTLCLSSVRYR